MLKKYLRFIGIGVAAVTILSIYSWSKSENFKSQLLERGPYVQMLSKNSATIKWKTSSRKYGVVRYGLSPSSLTTIVEGSLKTRNHSIQLTGLKPGSKYFYSIGYDDEILQGDSLNYFHTFPLENNNETLAIWVIGDAGSGREEQNKMRDAYLSVSGNKNPDIWLWLGDNAYERGLEEEYQEHVFNNHFEDIMKNTPVYSCPGNHDMANIGYQNLISKTFAFPYFSIFENPENGESGGVPSRSKHYYSFNYQNIHFVSLDSYGSENDLNSEMYQWLKSDLKQNKQYWTVVFFHHPPYTKGTHDSDLEDEMIDMRMNIVPLLENHGVDLVLSGHSHVYERSHLINGHYGTSDTFNSSMILDKGDGGSDNFYFKNASDNKGTMYLVVGNSGKGGGRKEDWPHPAMTYSESDVMGSLKLEVHGDSLAGKFIDIDAKIRDEFVLIKK